MLIESISFRVEDLEIINRTAISLLETLAFKYKIQNKKVKKTTFLLSGLQVYEVSGFI